jgi:hypothetical protein
VTIAAMRPVGMSGSDSSLSRATTSTASPLTTVASGQSRGPCSVVNTTVAGRFLMGVGIVGMTGSPPAVSVDWGGWSCSFETPEAAYGCWLGRVGLTPSRAGHECQSSSPSSNHYVGATQLIIT